MRYPFVYLTPFILFIVLYLGTGIILSYQGYPEPFGALSPVIAILPAVLLAFSFPQKQRLSKFLKGLGDPDVLLMVLIFLLAGAFGQTAHSLGAVNSLLHLAQPLFHFATPLVALFLLAALISTSIGTSMGTIATLAPLTLSLTIEGSVATPALMGAIVSGAMFGDNLSLISDTTIAAVISCGSDLREKLKFNGFLAIIASLLTILFYAWQGSHMNLSLSPSSSLWLASPYLILTILALCRLHVLIVLVVAIFSCLILGLIYGHYHPLMFAQDLFRGFASMQEIVLLTMLIGGLSELTLQGQQWLGKAFFNPNRSSTYKKYLPLKIASLALFYDLLLANNTIAILLTSKLSKPVADQEKLSPPIHATILDIYTCVAQGLLPYGAQLLLAASLASLPPILIIPHVIYCLILGLVTTLWIFFAYKKFFSS